MYEARLARIVLDVAVEEGGDEVQVDPHDPVLAPDWILEPVEVPQALSHLIWRRPEADAVSRALVRQ